MKSGERRCRASSRHRTVSERKPHGFFDVDPLGLAAASPSGDHC
jgi:hypothetical protein